MGRTGRKISGRYKNYLQIFHQNVYVRPFAAVWEGQVEKSVGAIKKQQHTYPIRMFTTGPQLQEWREVGRSVVAIIINIPHQILLQEERRLRGGGLRN